MLLNYLHISSNECHLRQNLLESVNYATLLLEARIPQSVAQHENQFPGSNPLFPAHVHFLRHSCLGTVPHLYRVLEH